MYTQDQFSKICRSQYSVVQVCSICAILLCFLVQNLRAQSCNSCETQYDALGIPNCTYPPPCCPSIIPEPVLESFSKIRYVIDITSYGANPSDNIDDTPAFEKVSCIIKEICRRHKNIYGSGFPHLDVVLNIPSGTYYVGREYSPTFDCGDGPPANCLTYLKRVPNVLHLVDCFNVTIQGAPNWATKIKYNQGLDFGAINNGGGCIPNSDCLIPEYTCTAIIGTCIYLENCQNITVSRIDADGSVRPQNNLVRLHYGLYDNGIQLPFDGISIIDSFGSTRNIVIDSVNIHHFGRDGIMIRCATPKGFNFTEKDRNNITILDSRFEYNVRQGLSWVGGLGLTVENCDFNHTGKANPHRPASEMTICIPPNSIDPNPPYPFSNPGAGVDLEPDGNAINSDGVFRNCRMLNNLSWGIISTSGGEGSTRNVTFDNCTVFSNVIDKGSAIGVLMPEFTFKNCNIYGKVNGGYEATTDAQATKYENCLFSDTYVDPSAGVQAATLPLIDAPHYSVRRMQFINCRFENKDRSKAFIVLNSNHFSIEDRCRFVDCQFDLLDQKGFQVNGIGTIAYCIFSGNNIIKNQSPGFSMDNNNYTNQTLTTFGLIIDGSLTVRGPIYLPLHHYTCGADLLVGPTNSNSKSTLRLENQAFLHLHNSVLAVGGNAKIELNGTNAALYASELSKVFLDDKGTLESNNGSYLCINENAVFRRSANSVTLYNGITCLPPNIYPGMPCPWNYCWDEGILNVADTGVAIQTEGSEALFFDGYEDRAYGVPNPDNVNALNIANKDFTVSVFYKPDNRYLLNPSQIFLVAKHDAATGKGYAVGLQLAGTVYRPFLRVNNHTVNANFTLRYDCTLLTIVRKGNCIDFYENGNLRQSIPVTFELNWDMVNNASLVLAAQSLNQTNSFFGGWIGEVGIWQKALCPTEVAAHFQGTVPSVSRNQTIVFWDFTADLIDQEHKDHYYGGFAKLIRGNSTLPEATDPTWWMEHQISCSNGAQLRDMAVAETLEEVHTWQVSVYPNPFNDRIYVTLPAEQTQQAEISLYSTEGKLIFQQRSANTAGAVELDVDVPPGFYMLEVRQGENRQTVKVLKI